ncbi:MAG: hypothetical protein FWC85_03300 [Elusimicrobia bacterium]|nr:hypothetical protein [Elusimicrobiota bacterium]
MKVNLTQRDIELIIHLVNEYALSNSESEAKLSYSMDELLLLDKLEVALRDIEYKQYGFSQTAKPSRYN